MKEQVELGEWKTRRVPLQAPAVAMSLCLFLGAGFFI
ncbi:hypothetical protein JOE21_001324 [Desmospora profundinema]|uniref:Uncharacterized protein n=1 Tax=Desmospora profundinema TaxID=1571184 RepID=A0ABU1IKM8_9BACL|nr:hypothetical protein [Desmospora profundinema]